MDNQYKSVSPSEIKFLDILLFINRYIGFLAATAAGSIFSGVIFTYSQPEKYEAQTKLLPEYGSSARSSFSLVGSALRTAFFIHRIQIFAHAHS